MQPVTVSGYTGPAEGMVERGQFDRQDTLVPNTGMPGSTAAAQGEEPAGQVTNVRWTVLAWLCVASAIAYLQRNSISVLESTIREELNLTKTQMGAMMSGFFWSYAFCQIPAGWLGGRFGSRLILPIYSTVWSLATLMMAAAGTALLARFAGTGFIAGMSISLIWLTATRVLAGAAQAGIFPCAAVVVDGWIPRSQRGLSTGLLGGFMQVGGVAATALTGLMLVKMDWQWVLVWFAVPGILWSLGFYVWFRDRPGEHPGVSPAERELIRQGVAVRPAAEAAGTTPPAGAVTRKPAAWEMLLSPAMWCICSQQFFRAFAYMFFASWFATWLQEARGVSVKDSGLLTSLPLLANLISAPFGGSLSDFILRKTGSTRLARPILAAACMLFCGALIFAARMAEDPTMAVVLISLGSFGAGVAGPMAYATTIDMTAPHVPTAFGLMNMSGNIGAALFPIVVPVLLKLNGSVDNPNWDAVMVTFAGAYILAAVFWLLLPNRANIFEE